MKLKQQNTFVLKYFLGLFLISILLLGRLLWPFLSILVLSFLLAGIFQPIFTFLVRHQISPTFASILTCLMIIFLVFVPLTFFVGALSQEAFALYQIGKNVNLGLKLRELIEGNALLANLQTVLENHGITLQAEGFSNTISEFTKIIGLFLYNKASSWAANLLSFVFSFFMMIITIFFLLIDHEKLINYILRLSPLPENQGRNLLKKFVEIAGAVLIGNGICGIIQGVLGGLLFSFFNLGPPVLWGGVMGILAFLPIFGIGLVLLPAGCVMLLKGKLGLGIFIIVFYAILSFSIEYLLKPKLVGTQVKMHTLLVFLAIMGGLSVFGFLGIIYGPLIITAFLTLAEIYLANYDSYLQTFGAVEQNKK